MRTWPSGSKASGWSAFAMLRVATWSSHRFGGQPSPPATRWLASRSSAGPSEGLKDVVRLRNAARGAGCSRCYGGHQPSLEETRWLASRSSPEEGGKPDGERRLVPEEGIEPTLPVKGTGF
jgi:hypothetical protein